MAKKVVRVKAVVKGGKVVGTRQTNTNVGTANKLLSKLIGKPGGGK